MKTKQFDSLLRMFEGLELGDDTADTPAWYIVGVDGHIVSGPYGSKSEASSDTRRLQWYNTSNYDIAYGLQNDDDMFVDAETGTVGEGVGSADVDGTPNVTGHRIPQKGDTIRTKNGVTGKVYAQKGQSVYFTVADGPAQSCLLNSCKVVQELEDSDVYEAETDNFTVDDIKRLEKIQDMPTLKAQAKELVKGKAARRMKPEKIVFFYDKIDSMSRPMAIIKLMYDLLLAGEGNSVLGSRNNMNPNSYRSRFGEGGMGGINRAAPAQDVSYEKVLDEVTAKYRVDELSVDKMKAYQQAARSDKSMNTRPLRKVAHTVAGVKQASDKIRTKTGDRRGAGGNVVMGNLEERLAQFVNEVDMSQFQDILNKQYAEKPAAAKPRTVEFDYHGWLIRHTKQVKPTDQVRWQVMNKKTDEIVKSGTAQTEKDAVQDAQDYITAGAGQSKELSKTATIDFNVNFAREFAPEGETFYARIERGEKGAVLKLSTEPREGYKRSHIRNQKDKITGTTTQLPMIPMTPAEANAAGLEPHGRYLLGDKSVVDNIEVYPLILQGKTQSKTDTVRMGKPGLTVATKREVDVDEDMKPGTSPWGGDPKKLAKSPKSAMQGTPKIPFSELVQDTIKTHGLKWAFDFYVKKHGLPTREFRIFAGI